MAEGFVMTLLSLSLSGACLAAAAEVLARLLGSRISPELRRLLWLLVLVRLLCPWSLSGGVLDRGAEEWRQAAAWSGLPETGGSPQGEEAAVQTYGAEQTDDFLSPFPALTALWAAGFLVAAGRRGLGYARLCRELRDSRCAAGGPEEAIYARLTAGENRPPELWVSSAAPCPMLVGLLRPRLVLPALELSEEELEGVFAHELAHWRRKDLWMKWMAALAASVHWFNPALGLLTQRLDRDCELCCDRAAVRGWDRRRRARYGELLLRLAAGNEAQSVLLFSQKQRLEERLISMMEEKKYGKKAAVLGAAACLALMLTSTALGAYTGPAAVGEMAQGAGLEITPTALSWPVEAGETVELSARFETRIHPITGQKTQHSGIDLPEPGGTPVLAAADGTVLEAAFDAAGDGNYVLLRHGSMTTKYAHLQEFSVEPGQSVSAGEEIGLVGRTGMATGDHLHFEVAVDGTLADPLDYLDSTQTAAG